MPGKKKPKLGLTLDKGVPSENRRMTSIEPYYENQATPPPTLEPVRRPREYNWVVANQSLAISSNHIYMNIPVRIQIPLLLSYQMWKSRRNTTCWKYNPGCCVWMAGSPAVRMASSNISAKVLHCSACQAECSKARLEAPTFNWKMSMCLRNWLMASLGRWSLNASRQTL